MCGRHCLNRKFPQDLRITEEYSSLVMLQVVWGWFYEIVLLFESNKQSPQLVESCIPALQIRTEFLLDMLRSMMFSVIIGYFSTTRERSKPQVPSYNMHYLTDFSVDV